MAAFKDLTGMKFSRLEVLRRVDNQYTKGGRPMVTYRCVCNCGQELDVCAQKLTSGNTKSCGCLQREVRTNNGRKNKKYNTYNLSGSYGIGYTLKGEEFYFDLEDYDKIKDFCWRKASDGYITAKDTNTGCLVSLHRLIMGTREIPYSTGIRVDHIRTEEKFDNRKCNLRIVQHYENGQNHKIHSSNTSGVSGVSYNKSHRKWYSWISHKGIRYNLGFFDNFEDAVLARKKAEQELYGEHSYDNSQKLANENSVKLKQEEKIYG